MHPFFIIFAVSNLVSLFTAILILFMGLVLILETNPDEIRKAKRLVLICSIVTAVSFVSTVVFFFLAQSVGAL